MSESAFEIGNSIGWNFSPFPGLVEKDFMKRYGTGPFTAVQVIEVPAEQVRGVGHTQWVEIETPKGITRFSGIFFKKV